MPKRKIRIPVQAISETLPSGKILILLHSEGFHITCASLIKVTYSLMMYMVVTMPPVIWSEDKQAGYNSNHCVHAFRPEE